MTDTPHREDSSSVSKGGARRVTDWAVSAYATLKSFVIEAKGAESEPVVNFVRDHLKGTKMILVVGNTGSGKTTLLKELTGMDLKVGYTMQSGTREYEVCPILLERQQYLFVDTPGFGAADKDNMSAFDDIVTCLNVLGPFVEVAGVWWVYGKVDNRYHDHDLRTLQRIQCSCGPKFYRSVAIITTQWDSWSQDDFHKAWKRKDELVRDGLRDLLDPPERIHGAVVHHHGIIEEPAGPHALSRRRHTKQRSPQIQGLARRLYADSPRIKLQFVKELEDGKQATETEASKVLMAGQSNICIVISSGRAVVLSRMALGPEPNNDGGQLLLLAPPEPQAKRTHQSNQKAWGAAFFEWLEAAKQVAVWFMEARKAAAQRTAQPGLGVWASLKQWWAGKPPGH